MKLPAKPMSSPGRPEKYAPPLMMFLRSNVGSTSRGSRSRSSPMFVRKRNAAAIETQEPSSPKVTCMGQVRVSRSKQSKTRAVKPKRRCKWVHNASFCHHLDGKLKVKSFRPAWRKLALFCNVGFNRKSETRDDSSISEPKFVNGRPQKEEEDEESEEGESKIHVSGAFSPPKNALLLTRCKSAPHRSSSLASIFWESPWGSEATKQKQSTELENRGDDSPTSKTGSVCRESDDQDSRLDPENEEKLEIFKEIEGSITSIIRDKIMKPAKIEELGPNDEGPGNLRPLILTRCKSEPSKTGEKLDLEINFWKKRRLGST